MTDADLAAIAGALEAERALWAARLTAQVDRALDDAHAHASRAVTETLRRTPDGRPTIRRATANPSYRAALSRLGELWTRLSGPSKDSLRGQVRDAREAFYRLAFRLHAPFIPASIRVAPEPLPTGRGVDLVRAAAVHGIDPRKELEGPIADAARKLSAAVAVAGARDADGPTRADQLGAWHDRSRRAIAASVLSLLSDSVEHANAEAMADLVHPDFRA